MEEIPMYSTYDICQHQGCQCRSCGHDQGGNCLADTGDCIGAREQGRCPVEECPFYKARGSEIRAEIEFCRITCPACGGQSYIQNWGPGRCPHCDVPLGGLTDADLRAESRSVTISIDQLTGQAVVVP